MPATQCDSRHAQLLSFLRYRSLSLTYRQWFASAINAKFTRFDGATLRAKFPMMRFDESCHGLYEDDGGVLRADRCLLSLQVSPLSTHCYQCGRVIFLYVMNYQYAAKPAPLLQAMARNLFT